VWVSAPTTSAGFATLPGLTSLVKGSSLENSVVDHWPGMTPEPAKAQREHILIVEADRETSKSLAALLKATGYEEIRAVRSTSRALSVAARFHPAIAFLGTPAPDGIEGELASLLQKNSRTNGIRLIGLTDSIEHPSREAARASGVERYLSKPVTQIELEKALRKTPGN